MKTTWSEQLLVAEEFDKTLADGTTVTETENVLKVCTHGQDIFKKEFVDGKYEQKNKLIVPFDMFCLAGGDCPNGKFYELEYQIEGNSWVYRILVQAVNPVTDIRLLLGAVKKAELLPEGFRPGKAYLRDDIDKVVIGGCEADAAGGAYHHGDVYTSGVDSEQGSLLDICSSSAGAGVTVEFYPGQLPVQVIAVSSDMELMPKIFVAGSENVSDPEFAEQREKDLDEMMTCLNEAMGIAAEYDLQYLICIEGVINGRCSEAYRETVMQHLGQVMKKE